MKYLEPLKLYHELLKLKKTGPLLGLHVGRQGVGVSISDDSRKVATPLRIVVRTKMNIDFVASQFQTLISERSPELSPSGLVIGYPSDKRKSCPSARERFVEHFVDDLTKTGKFEDMNYTFFDESFTTKMLFEDAKRTKDKVKSFKVHPMYPKIISEEFAAFEILQGYLDFVNRNQDQTFPGEER